MGGVAIMLRMLWCTVWLLAAAGVPKHATAQRLGDIAPGTTMRIGTCENRQLQGRVKALRPNSIIIVSDSLVSDIGFPIEKVQTANEVAVDCIVTYSVFKRYGSSAGEGALVGGGIGVALIVLGEVADARAQRRGQELFARSVVLTVPLAVVLTLVGAGLGSISGPEEWTQPQFVTLRAAHGSVAGARFGVAFPFR
jgi:hypothetical protein